MKGLIPFVLLATASQIVASIECLSTNSTTECDILCDRPYECSDTIIDVRSYLTSNISCSDSLSCHNTTIFGPSVDLIITSSLPNERSNVSGIAVSDLVIFAQDTSNVTLDYPLENDEGGFSNVIVNANHSKRINIYSSGYNGFSGIIFANVAKQVLLECYGDDSCGSEGLLDIHANAADTIEVVCDTDYSDETPCANLNLYANAAQSVTIDCQGCVNTTVHATNHRNDSTLALACWNGDVSHPTCRHTRVYAEHSNGDVSINCEAQSSHYGYSCADLHVFANESQLNFVAIGKGAIDAQSRVYSQSGDTTLRCETYSTKSKTSGACLAQFYLNNNSSLSCKGYGCKDMKLYMKDTKELWKTINVDSKCSNCVRRSTKNCMAMDVYCGDTYQNHANLKGSRLCNETSAQCCYNATLDIAATTDVNNLECPVPDFGPMKGYAGYVILGVAVFFVCIIVCVAWLVVDKLDDGYAGM